MQDKPGVNKENETEQGLLGKPETQKPLVQRPKALNDRCDPVTVSLWLCSGDLHIFSEATISMCQALTE